MTLQTIFLGIIAFAAVLFILGCIINACSAVSEYNKTSHLRGF